MVASNVTKNGHSGEQRNDDNSCKSRSKHVLRDIALQKLRDNVKEIQEDVVQRVQTELDAMVHDVLAVVEKSPALVNTVDNLFSQQQQQQQQHESKSTDRHRENKKRLLAEKEFIPRASLLTELFEVKHIRSIYHMFIAVLIIAFLNNISTDVLSGAGVRLGLRYIHIGFGGFGWALVLWSVMFASTLAVYPMFCLWVEYRTPCWDTVSTILLTGYVTMFTILPPYWKGYDMSIASAAVVLLEQTRFLMKIHAFLRSNVPQVLSQSSKPIVLPGFDRFLYFLFAPTLVYRHTYPRTKCIRWSFVTARFVDVLGAMFMISFIVEHYLVPEFRGFGVQPHTWSTLAASVFHTMLPATMILLCGFFLLLHAWHNGWAEMLRFADRMFYRDWWNSASYGAYYRTWNVIVHDYLYEYIYRDVYVRVGRVLATCAVFSVSAIVHEYILGFMLGFCYPVMFVQFFGLGMALGFVKYNSAAGNVFLWMSLALGTGVQVSFYSMELCARKNCPPTMDVTWRDMFIPRSWSCHGLQ